MPTSKSRTIKSKVVGVTFRNADGTDRQAVIRQFCRAGVQLIVHREKNNPHTPDGNAIGLGINGHQIGYIRGELVESAGLIEHLDTGGRLEVVILCTTGGTAGDSHGVNIEITLLPPGATPASIVVAPPREREWAVVPPPTQHAPLELGWSWIDIPIFVFRSYHNAPDWVQAILWGGAFAVAVVLVVVVYVHRNYF